MSAAGLAAPDPALDQAVTLIAGFEGFRSQPYRDAAGFWTNGFGFRWCADGQPVTADTPAMDYATGLAKLRFGVSQVLVAVRQMAKPPLTVNQAAALCSLAYNCGVSAISHSTLIARLNTDAPLALVATLFSDWIHEGGVVDPGLVIRRGVEAQLFVMPEAA